MVGGGENRSWKEMYMKDWTTSIGKVKAQVHLIGSKALSMFIYAVIIYSYS